MLGKQCNGVRRRESFMAAALFRICNTNQCLETAHGKLKGVFINWDLQQA